MHFGRMDTHPVALMPLLCWVCGAASLLTPTSSTRNTKHPQELACTALVLSLSHAICYKEVDINVFDLSMKTLNGRADINRFSAVLNLVLLLSSAVTLVGSDGGGAITAARWALGPHVGARFPLQHEGPEPIWAGGLVLQQSWRCSMELGTEPPPPGAKRIRPEQLRNASWMSCGWEVTLVLKPGTVSMVTAFMDSHVSQYLRLVP